MSSGRHVLLFFFNYLRGKVAAFEGISFSQERPIHVFHYAGVMFVRKPWER